MVVMVRPAPLASMVVTPQTAPKVQAKPRVCGTFRERTEHPCQMPEAVLERIIRVASNPGDLVLDPFAGSGTTVAVAKKLGRKYLGVELSDVYADGVRKRLQMIEFAEPRKTRKREKSGHG